MNMRLLLTVTAIVELASGIALLAAPSAGAQLLVGEGLASPALMVVGRFVGAALAAIGVTCWRLRHMDHPDSRVGLLLGLLTYNVAAPSILLEANVLQGVHGLALWPAVGLHLFLGLWCIACLRALPIADSRSAS
jgi:hypothetical protein